jgi:hypothetical protein
MTNRLKLTGKDKFLSGGPVNRLETVNCSCSKIPNVKKQNLLLICLEDSKMQHCLLMLGHKGQFAQIHCVLLLFKKST